MRPRPIGARPASRKLFRGPTPPNVIQTLDIGSCTGDYLVKRARKNSKQEKNIPRKYAAVDPLYEHTIDLARVRGKQIYISNIIERLKKNNILTSSKMAHEFIQELAQKGMKVRHVNFQMPHPEQENNYNFREIFSSLKKVLLPEGKVFMSSEQSQFLARIVESAKSEGYIVSEQKTLDPRTNSKRNKGTLKTMCQKSHYRKNYIIYRVVLTLSPKTLRNQTRKPKA